VVSMRTVEISVGAFVIAGVIALSQLAFQVSGLTLSNNRPTYELNAYFDNVSGLTDRARVSMAGVVVGHVRKITLDPATYRARVTMEIYRDTAELSTDSSASIQTSGLLGEKYISVATGGEEDVLKDGGVIQDTQSSLVLEELIGKLLTSLTSSNKEEPAQATESTKQTEQSSDF
jgi:phospholipid/cholesterol/gamma-HCH transport system substrate-binding protein